MQDYIYSAVAFLAMVIHLIINFNLLIGRGEGTMRAMREYRGYLAGIFVFYIADAAWGVLSGLGWTNVLYADTVLFFVTIAVSVLMWCHFAVAYLEISRWAARTIAWLGYAILALFAALLTANCFNGCLFSFDAAGNYSPTPLRNRIFFLLAVLNVLMAVFVLVKSFGRRSSMRRRSRVVFLFSLTMAVAIVFQIEWPLWPYYALGCLIGNCFLHVFAIEEERAELRRAVIEREEAAKHAAELEKALARARAAEKARSMFFSIVSHDIRTPLNAILGYSELLEKGCESPAERNEALKSIRASGTILLQLVNDVLDLAKMDAGKMTFQPKPVRLAQLVGEVFASFRLAADRKGLALVDRTDGVPELMLDAHRFRQILFNLVGNSVKFTDSGTVSVEASYVGTKLSIVVSDTGRGIPPDLLPRVLDPFVQAQDASHCADRIIGTGLGLSICRSFVEAMGGEICVESELGKGSKFKICIPGVEASGEKARPPEAPKPAPELKDLPRRVLVVDDSPVNRAVLTALLKKTGVASFGQACDGAEAFAALESSVNSDSPYDFVFSDFWMPNMNGLEFVEKIRGDGRFKDLPVFALTADTEIHGDDRANLFTGVLLKPLTYDKLVAVFCGRS